MRPLPPRPPGLLSAAAQGVLTVGLLSLAGLALSGLSRLVPAARPRPPAPPGPRAWRLPLSEPLVDEALTASAASGY